MEKTNNAAENKTNHVDIGFLIIWRGGKTNSNDVIKANTNNKLFSIDDSKKQLEVFHTLHSFF